jgi:hypothetical protein
VLTCRWHSPSPPPPHSRGSSAARL